MSQNSGRNILIIGHRANMKIITASSGKRSIKIAKSEWERIGETAGWIKVAGWLNRPENKYWVIFNGKIIEGYTVVDIGKEMELGYKIVDKKELKSMGLNPTKMITGILQESQPLLEQKLMME